MQYNAYTKDELFSQYGYLLSKEQGKYIELLIDVLRETGCAVTQIGSLYAVYE